MKMKLLQVFAFAESVFGIPALTSSLPRGTLTWLKMSVPWCLLIPAGFRSLVYGSGLENE